MRETLLDAVHDAGGAITRNDALAVVGEHVLADAVKAGVLLRPLPGVYTSREVGDDLSVRRRAALLYVPDGALSHTDALDVWELPATCDTGSVHVTAGRGRHSANVPGLVLHRRTAFVPGAPFTVVRGGLSVVRLEQAIVESWPLLPAMEQNAPAIVAVRDRRTTAARLLSTLHQNPRIEGTAQMRALFGLLRRGCHSELEIWGHANVFDHPSLPPSVAQRPVRVGGRVVYLDRAYELEMVDAELDGAAFHGGPGQRERDLRRDAAVARLGWLPVRFSHPRLHTDPDDARGELLDILSTRRRQLGLPPMIMAG